VNTITTDAATYVAGAQNRSPFLGLTGASSHARCFAPRTSGHYGSMVGPAALALALVAIGLIAAVAVPAVGWILLVILVIVAILILVRAVAGGRQTAPKA